jgi:hypothetical protein
MRICGDDSYIRWLLVLFIWCGVAQAQSTTPDATVKPGSNSHYNRESDQWFLSGRRIPKKSSAELHRRAYQAKLMMRTAHMAALRSGAASQSSATVGSWTPLGPAPLSSDATGNGTQDYRQVSGRSTAVAIDPADASGNTVYIGAAQGGVWKSTNAANATANSVTWNAVSDDQATLSIGALAIQPGNADPAKSLILAATGEADNSLDSYYGLGILRSADAGNSWTLITTANGGALSFSGLGGARMAFSTAQSNIVVSAMASSSEGLIDGAVSANTMAGLYTSLDAGQTWTYDSVIDPSGATDATSATSVIYNPRAGQFFAAVRYHGFYSSPDGVNWARLPAQPGGTLLAASACPPQSTANGATCPLYRAEITAVPGRNEMYAWFIYFSTIGDLVDGGIWQSLNGGFSWSAISETGITNCGDFDGCGAEDGSYNLELAAMPNASGTDLYAGAINLYKCSINSQNPTCTNPPFLNLTHAYGCDPIAAPAHVNPGQHALAYVIPTAGGDSGNGLMYFANDGGVYRALNGFSGLTTGSCAGANQFDDLNQNLGSITQFVGFSQHPTDPNTLLGGAAGSGSPATNQAISSSSWINVLGGDGGYDAIDPTTPSNFYASTADIPPGGLAVQACSDGVNCVDSSFTPVVTSASVGGDDGGFYFPYVLDPKSLTSMLVGTCRVWRGSRAGDPYTALSPNFDTLGSGTCSGNEVNQVRALAIGGPTDGNGSQVIYATTDGLGPIEGQLAAPPGGRVWVSTNATVGPAGFADVTDNGPQGNINPNQFPISSVTIDASDRTGSTAYVTVMGFTGAGNGGHVWKTSNAGAAWTDVTGNLPDAPVNAVIVDDGANLIYVGTDVGVFSSSTSAANWAEVGPESSQSGFLPNAAVTGLGLFNSGGLKLLRASTYGRGIWQLDLLATPDYQLSIPNSNITVFSGQTTAFAGTATALNGYASAVTLSCVGAAVPATCNSPTPVTPGVHPPAPFNIEVGGVDGDYSFNVQGVGADPNQVTHIVPVILHVVSFALTVPSPNSVTVPRGTASPLVNFQVTAAGNFDQSVNIACSTSIPGAICIFTPASAVNPTSTAPVGMTASVFIPVGTAIASYPVTIQATTSGSQNAITALFSVNVTANPDFVLAEPSAFPEVIAGSTGTTGPITIAAQDGFTGTVTLNCALTFGANSCSITPASVTSLPATVALVVNGSSFAAGSYSLSVAGISDGVTHTISVPIEVGDFAIAGPQALALNPGAQGIVNLTLTSLDFYSGTISATCDASALSGAMCLLSPASPVTVTSTSPANVRATINILTNALPGNYNIVISTQDTTGTPSHSFPIVLTVAPDFLVVSATPSQTVNAGQSTGAYNLSVLPVGAVFNSAVTLSCSGLPDLSQCLFNPPGAVTPGGSAVNVLLTISTTAPTTAAQRPAGRHSILYAVGMLLPAIVLIFIGGSACSPAPSRKLKAVGFGLTTILLLMVLVSCGGVSTGGGGGGGGGGQNHPGTPPGTYTITVTGTSPGAQPDAGQSTQVILVVN